jgi:transcriptional regulator with XRE-family HTH domain
MHESRTAIGLNGKDMARRLMVTEKSVQNWEHNKVIPYTRSLLDWAAVTGVTVEWLLTDVDDDGNQTVPDDGLAWADWSPVWNAAVPARSSPFRATAAAA